MASERGRVCVRPTVSVVLPVYRGRRFLRGAVESVLAQSLAPAELLIVDDASDDGSLDALAGLVAPFPLRVLRHEHNAGQSAARNRGVRESVGDLVAFLDQDDLWHPEHLERLAAPLVDDPAVGWVYCDFDEIDGDGQLVTRSFLRHVGMGEAKATLSALVARDLMVLPSASLLRRAALVGVGGFDEELSGYEDDDLFVRVFRAGWGHVFVERSLVRFRIHGSSSSAGARFLASRRRFAAKLATALPDDPRMRRYYLRDVVAPRFFETSLDDYVRACSSRDWAAAELALAALNEFAAQRRPSLGLRWKMAWVQSPRLFRLLMRFNDALPRRLRYMRHPHVTLR